MTASSNNIESKDIRPTPPGRASFSSSSSSSSSFRPTSSRIPPPPASAAVLGIPAPRPAPPRTAKPPLQTRLQAPLAGTSSSSSSSSTDLIAFSPIQPSPDGQRVPPALPSRPTPPTSSLTTSSSPTSAAFQTIELASSTTTVRPQLPPRSLSVNSLDVVSSSRGPPPPLPQRPPTGSSEAVDVPYAARTRRMPPTPPKKPPGFSGAPSLKPRPSMINVSSGGNASGSASAVAEARARYTALFSKLVALRRVAAMQAALKGGEGVGASSSTGAGASGGKLAPASPGWKRASVSISSSGSASQGKLDGVVVKAIWEKSRLDAETLSKIWCVRVLWTICPKASELLIPVPCTRPLGPALTRTRTAPSVARHSPMGCQGSTASCRDGDGVDDHERVSCLLRWHMPELWRHHTYLVQVA